MQKYKGRFHIFIFIVTQLPKEILQDTESSLFALFYEAVWNFCINITKEEVYDGFVCGWSEERRAEWKGRQMSKYFPTQINLTEAQNLKQAYLEKSCLTCQGWISNRFLRTYNTAELFWSLEYWINKHFI